MLKSTVSYCVLGRGKGLESNFEDVLHTMTQGILSLSLSHYLIKIYNRLDLISVSNDSLDIELDSMSVVPKM